MKIIFVAKVFAEWGGLERVWTDKMNALSQVPDYEVWLVTTDQGSHSYPYVFSSKVHLVDLNIRFVQQYQYGFLKRIWVKYSLMRVYKYRFQQLLYQIKPDVLVTNSSENVSILNRWRGGIPLVVECHGTCDRPFHMDKMTIYKRIKSLFFYHSIAKANRLVALTQKDADKWKRINPQACSIADIVHLNDTETYSDCLNKRVIFVGRIDPQKGYSYLKDIWQLVSERHPDWRLDIYGEGADKVENKEMLPAGENIFAHPHTSDIFNKYKESSILILTSVYEPFGLVMPEAMSCGVPVVAFDCPYGPSDIITDGKDGFLVKTWDVNEFANKTCLLMENEQLRREFGRNAMISSRRFSSEKIIPQWINLYEKLVNNSF